MRDMLKIAYLALLHTAEVSHVTAVVTRSRHSVTVISLTNIEVTPHIVRASLYRMCMIAHWALLPILVTNKSSDSRTDHYGQNNDTTRSYIACEASV